MERTEIEQKVRAFLIDDLEIDEDKVFPESRLKEDMGIDSLDYVDIVAVVLSTFGIKSTVWIMWTSWQWCCQPSVSR